MSDTLWTWLLFGMELIGIYGMLMAGRKHWWGWLVVMLHSVPWFVYAVMFDKPGFMAMSILWWSTHLYNGSRWYAEKKQTQTPPVPQGFHYHPYDNERAQWCGTFSGRRQHEK